MDSDFEKFQGGPNEPMSRRLYVTLSPTHNIVINRNIYERMGRPPAVNLYYSRKREAIGVEAAKERSNGAFPVVANGPSGWRISAAPFCRHYDIRVNRTMKFIDPQLEGDVLTLNLRETISVARRKRRRKTD